VHRDVSPANVLLNTVGEVKIIDFGVAKALDRIVEETSAGMLKGKVTFMAPEQAMGKRIDRRADVWACGVMLYQLLSARLPYDAESQIATLHLLVRGTPPTPLRDVPDDVAELAYTALSYAPEGRYSTADEMHRAIETVLVQRCGAVTAADISEYVNRQLEDRLAKRKQMIARAVRAAEERSQIADEFAQSLPSDQSSSNFWADLHTPILHTAETAFGASEEKTAQSQYQPDPAPPAYIAPSPVRAELEPASDLELDLDDLDVKRFGTRKKTPLVIAGFIAAIALVSYASYLVWDRISMGETPSLSH
jgi:serine/threonine-protein kinase